MDFFLRPLLHPLSWLFSLLVALKNNLYQRGVLATQELHKPVVSIGNLSMGGTGKSPVVGALIEAFEERGRRVAVLSRGYGRRNPKKSLRVDAKGDWRDFGDEPMMLAMAHPNAQILVGPSRYKASQMLAEDVDLFLIDDGFQHRQLKRDVDIVLLDINQGFPQVFPLGPFREGWSALKRADLVVLTRVDNQDITPWKAQIALHNDRLPVIAVSFRAETLRRLDTGATITPEDIRDKKVAAYAGIARPEKFFRSLESLGLKIVVKQALGDHQQWDQAQRNKLFAQCRKQGIKHIITTEKDAVKLDNWEDSDILLCSLSLSVNRPEVDKICEVVNRLI